MDRNSSADRLMRGNDTMARVYLTKEDEQLGRLWNFMIGTCYTRRITQTDLADVLGVKQPSISYMFRNKSMSLEDFVAIMNVLGVDVTKCIEGVEK